MENKITERFREHLQEKIWFDSIINKILSEIKFCINECFDKDYSDNFEVDYDETNSNILFKIKLDSDVFFMFKVKNKELFKKLVDEPFNDIYDLVFNYRFTFNLFNIDLTEETFNIEEKLINNCYNYTIDSLTEVKQKIEAINKIILINNNNIVNFDNKKFIYKFFNTKSYIDYVNRKKFLEENLLSLKKIEE